MTSTLTVPKSDIAIGRVTIDGQVYDVPQTPEFVRFFFDLGRRVGGVSGDSSANAKTTYESIGSVIAGNAFQVRPQTQLDVRGDSYISVIRDGQGFQLSLSPDSLFATIVPYLPKRQQLPVVNDAAGSLLAGQIFGD